MPRTGKPSKGCYRCRQRRIKCDLEQPECRKCLSLGQPCPGYRKEEEFRFQNESQDSYPESSSRDRRKANVSSSWVLPSRTTPSVTFKVALSDMAAHIDFCDKLIYTFGSPPQIVSESWDDYAIPFVISQFSARTTDGERFYGFMDFFPEMVAKASSTSLIVLCCKAVAFMYFNNRYPVAEEGTNRRIDAYGKALSATNAALSDRDLCEKDETLVSIWLLSIYEGLCGATMSLQCPGRPPTWNMHILGLTSLVQMKACPQFLSGSGRRFFWMVMQVIESRSLAAGVECPKEIFVWLEEHITDFVPEELDVHHALIHGYHASVLCANIRKIINTGELQKSHSILKVIEEARKIGRETETCLAQDPITRLLPLRQAHIHNFHRAVRIHVQYIILELLQSSIAGDDTELTPKFLWKQQKLSISIVQDLTQNTLATIPYILGPGESTDPTTSEKENEVERARCWGDGLRILWPLRVIGSRKVISKEQRDVVEETLQRLNSELYIRAAVVPYAIPTQMQLAKPLQTKAPKGSKACKTCKRRKVKCDEEKPLCQRCRASQLDCEGYESASGGIYLAQISTFDQGSIGRLDESTMTQ